MAKSRNDFTKNAINIFEAINTGILNPHKLKRKERLGLVAFLRNEGQTQEEIAKFLSFCAKTIWLDCRDIKRNAAQLVDEITVKRIGGELMREAEVLISKAKKAKDYKLAWQIRCDLIDKLQSMGFVYRAPDKLEHSGEIKAAEIKIFNIINAKSDKEINGLFTSGNDRQV